MNAELLLEHYSQIADAPDAIAQLREFVLVLAMQGKATSFNGPWRNATLGDLGAWGSGGTPSKSRPEFYGGGIPWLVIGDLNDGVVERSQASITEAGLANSSAKLISPGTVLIAMYGSIGKLGIAGIECATNQAIAYCVPAEGIVSRQFLFWLLRSLRKELLGRGQGIAQQNISQKILKAWPVQLPPLAEQHRIVAKVDELMALCDQLENAQADREMGRDKLTLSTLAKLNQPDPETFADDARFALEHLELLTKRTDQIKQLRQTILNLAVRGKLVAQDPNDEPASVLLSRINTENQRLMREKGIRAQKPGLPIDSLKAPVQLPSSWQRVYLQDIAYQITDGTHQTPKYTESGKPFLSAQNIKPFRFMPEKHRFVSEADFESYRANRRPERGDILMTRVGAGIGEAAVLNSDFEFAFYVSLCLIKVPVGLVSAEYLTLWLNSPEGRDSSTMRTYGKGASQGNLNLGLIRTFNVPLPPLSEQHRIVAKVEELMALCDQLEASLVEGAQTRAKLLEAVLHEALDDE